MGFTPSDTTKPFTNYLTKSSDPSAPPAGSVKVFASASSLYAIDEDGTITDLGQSGGGGSGGGIAMDGSTSNGVLTYLNSSTASVESNLTFDGSTLAVAGALTTTGNATLGNASTDVTTVTGQLTASQGATFVGHTYITGAMRISASADSYITGGPNDYPAALIVTGTLPNEGVLLRVENANLNAGTGYGAAAYFRYDDLYVALCDKNGSTGGNQGIETNGSLDLGGDLYVGGSALNIRGQDGTALMAFRGHSLYDELVIVNVPLSSSMTLAVGGVSTFGANVLPDVDNSYDLGSASKRWANVYTGDLHLKNERGNWTILEEEDYLCVINNKTGKKFKMMLQEIED